MKFTNHYAGSTVCAPTRSVIMSGLHTGHTPSRGNREIRPVGQFPIPASTFTIAEASEERPVMPRVPSGKWGLGNPGSEGDPIHQGFDRFFGYNCQRNAHTYYPTWLFDDLRKIELDGKTYAHDLIMDRTVEWIDDHHKRNLSSAFSRSPSRTPPCMFRRNMPLPSARSSLNSRTRWGATATTSLSPRIRLLSLRG